MGTVKNLLHLVGLQIKKHYLKKNCIVGLLLGGVISLKTSICYSSLVGSHTVNICEAFVLNFSRQGNALTILIGALIIFADAPFIDSGSFSVIHRIGRKKWYLTNWLYIMVLSLWYYIEILVISMIPFGFKGYLENRWSQSMLKIMKTYTKDMDRYEIFPPNITMEKVSPMQCTCFTIILVVLYTIFLVSIMYTLNMLIHKKSYGTILVAMIHALAVLMDSQGVLLPFYLERFSIFRNAFFTTGYDPNVSSVGFSITFFVLLIYIVFILGETLLPYTEFVLESGIDNE